MATELWRTISHGLRLDLASEILMRFDVDVKVLVALNDEAGKAMINDFLNDAGDAPPSFALKARTAVAEVRPIRNGTSPRFDFVLN